VVYVAFVVLVALLSVVYALGSMLLFGDTFVQGFFVGFILFTAIAAGNGILRFTKRGK
jgi:hypothetical protein